MILELLTEARTRGASDVHMTSDYPVLYRLHGELVNSSIIQVFKPDDVYRMLFSIMNEAQRKTYVANKELDFSFQDPEKNRFRVNAFHTMRGPAAVFRTIKSQVTSLEQLHAPEIITELSCATKGLILVVGPTGSGKSTTLCAMVDYVNQHFSRHIITVEDPIEFVHYNKKSLINQRELGSSVASFAVALKSALREDPDIILVGEMRDPDTIQLALTAAETGHLVFSTLHTNSAAKTINRVIDVFPPESKATIRSLLAGSIKAVISQRLIKSADGHGRHAAYEIMIANPSIRNLIREDKIAQINSIIELSKKSGMCLLRDSIKSLAEQGKISAETAEEELSNNE